MKTPENRGHLCNMMCREILTFNFGGNGTVDQLNEKYNLLIVQNDKKQYFLYVSHTLGLFLFCFAA